MVRFNLFRDVKVAGVASIYKFSCRSVGMYTATKSFERFQQPKSVEDEKKSVDNAAPKSTAYKTKWLCKVFEEWKQNRLVKSCTLETGGTNFGHGHYRYVCMQCQLLAVEVQEVSNSSGERYPSRVINTH